MNEKTFEEEVASDPMVCSRCDKRECTCWGIVNGSGPAIATAPTGKAFIVGLKLFYRDWEPDARLRAALSWTGGFRPPEKEDVR